MRTIAHLFAALIATLAFALPVTPAHALHVAYVSGTGLDTNDCTIPERACRTLGHVFTMIESGGDVICVGGGGQVDNSSVMIAVSVTIDCGAGGFSLGIITINGAGIVVRLRNLTINTAGLPTGAGNDIGINILNAAAVHVENCRITAYGTAVPFDAPAVGIKLAPGAGITTKLYVSDSFIADNGLTNSGGGIIVQPTGSGSARVEIARTIVRNNTYGIFANGTGSTGLIAMQIRDSVVSGSKFNGISAFTSAGQSTTSIVVDHSSAILSGGSGIVAQGPGGFVSLTDSTVMSNTLGLQTASGGGIFSYQNNRLTGNVTDGAPTGVLALK
jgi:hypothetical protein